MGLSHSARPQPIAVIRNSREVSNTYMRAPLLAMRTKVRDYFVSALV
jgi:hypothetical protein